MARMRKGQLAAARIRVSSVFDPWLTAWNYQ